MDHDDIVEVIDKNAQFICSRKPPKNLTTRAYLTRTFLEYVITREFDDAINNQYDLNAIFASRNELDVESRDDIDIAGTFGQFAELLYYPQVFHSLAEEYVEGVDLIQSDNCLARSMRRELCYTFGHIAKLRSEANIFLENSLRSKPGQTLSWDIFAFDQQQKLRQFRRVFQQTIPESLRA